MKTGVKKFILVTIAALSALAFSMAFIALCDLYFNPSKNNPATYSATEILFAGNGTESSPYLIESKEDIQELSDSIYDGRTFHGVYFKLMDDLDYDGEAFVPIGAKWNYFTGW